MQLTHLSTCRVEGSAVDVRAEADIYVSIATMMYRLGGCFVDSLVELLVSTYWADWSDRL